MTAKLRIKAARDRLAEAIKAKAEHVAKTEAKNAGDAAARRKLEKINALQATIDRSSGAELQPLASLTPSYGWNERDKTPKALLAALMDGSQKIEVAGATRTAKSIAKALRVWSREDTRKLRTLDRRIADLQEARRQHIKDAHERGVKMTEEAIASTAATVGRLRKNVVHRYAGDTMEDYEAKRLDTAIREAEQHLDYQTGVLPTAEDPPECPCNACIWERRQAAEKAAEQERIATLPRVMGKNPCPRCGKRHKYPIDREHNRWVKLDKDGETVQRQGVPIVYCAADGGAWMVWSPAVEALWAAEAKEAAAQAKEDAKKLAREGITWTCPHCQDSQTTLMLREHYYGNPDYAYVECESCEQTVPLAELIVGKAITANKARAVAFVAEAAKAA